MHTKGLTYSDHIVPYVGLKDTDEVTLEAKIKSGNLFAVGVNNPTRLGECRKSSASWQRLTAKPLRYQPVPSGTSLTAEPVNLTLRTAHA